MLVLTEDFILFSELFFIKTYFLLFCWFSLDFYDGAFAVTALVELKFFDKTF